MHEHSHAGQAIGLGKILGPASEPRLASALSNLTHRRSSLRDVALALQEKLAPVLRNTGSDQRKEPTNASAPCADSTVVMEIDAESRALREVEDLLMDLVNRLDV